MSAEFEAASPSLTNTSSPGRFILSHMARHPVVGVILVVGASLNAAMAAVVPYLVGQAFDAMAQPGGGGLAIVGAAALAIVAAQSFRAVVQFGRNAAAAAFAQRIERDVRDQLYASLLGKSMSYHDSLPVGETMARVTNDVRELNLMMYPGVNLIVGSGMFLIAPLVAAPLIAPPLILVPLAFVLLHVWIQYRFVRTMHPVAQNVRASFGTMNARLAEAIDGLQVVKGAAREDYEIRNFDGLADEVRDHFVEQGRIEARYLSYGLYGVALVFGFLHSVILYQSGVLLVGDIVAFNGLLVLFTFPVFTSLTSLSRLALGYASAGRIINVMNNDIALESSTARHRAPMRGAIRFEDVCFGYRSADGSEEKPVLHDITFDIQPGQTVALVGQTGAGKTSLTKLLNRIYDPGGGCIRIDDVPLRDWDLATLRSQISIIEQDIFLFSRSIADNIAFGVEDATREQIIEAAKKAQAHDFIMTFPDGYDTQIGQRGVTLSGGQRQRLAIARAFLKNPPVLILDDSTSAIDSATEDLIQKAIWSAAKGRTTILITHRLSQIRWADHIIVLKQGRIVAQGAHDDLLRESEAYRRIFARYEGGSGAVSVADAGQTAVNQHS